MGSSANSFPTVALRNFSAPENVRVFISCSLYEVPEMGIQNRALHCHKIIVPGPSSEVQHQYNIEVSKDSYTAE